MSARLKLKKLQKEMELVEIRCRMREYEATLVQRKCDRLLKDNIQEIGAFDELYPVDTYRDAIACLDNSVRAVANAIVRKYTERLSEHIRNQLTSKYMFSRFGKYGVRLLAPTLTEDHIKIDIKDH